MTHFIRIKRIYEQPEEEDGYRMLIDRLWPRGISKTSARIDEWNKEIAPSSALRIWFDHKAEHFQRFSELYKQELFQKTDELIRLRKISDSQNLTLVYAAKNSDSNHAKVLLEVINSTDL